ncbi:molybdenum cofactor sulfurase [Roseivirga sp. 4D4]|uniref:MOSC domain-containing protein n=1 Tax=Roseivirga sp. 4D4 TaxID=1889784 RepID=UPI0008535C4B|nr:MOSC domain-containing protein [Roseivirga sp. 4D4]OEK01872.1 molybdenum cofactor sulfurase [Roseivirga sp. 4D4]
MLGRSIKELTDQYAQVGLVKLVTIRPLRKEPPVILKDVEAIAEVGLAGDHYASKGGKRQVTLISREHIHAVASFMGKEEIDPLALRRNIVTTGINLNALKDKRFQIGEAVFEHTGECHPCSRMEENLGSGGYNAMRGHGGITCRVIQSGRITRGDSIKVFD